MFTYVKLFSFEYFINPNQDAASALYYLDFYVYSKITFVNTSPATTTGTPVWDFGDGTVIEGNEVIYAYKEAGTYPVKLTIGDFSKTQQIMIAPIKPIVKIKIGSGDPAEICEVAATPITFEVELPNPQNLEAKYTWEFPSGTTTNEVEKTYLAIIEGIIPDIIVNITLPSINNNKYLDEVLDKGAIKASYFAGKTIAKVKRKMGIGRK